jgi:hypothetical protein
MLYSRDTISLIDVKSALNSMELRTRLNGKGSDNQVDGLFVGGQEIKRKLIKQVPLLWLVLLKKIMRMKNLSLQLPIQMVVLTTSGSLILHVLLICPLKGISLLLTSQSKVV